MTPQTAGSLPAVPARRMLDEEWRVRFVVRAGVVVAVALLSVGVNVTWGRAEEFALVLRHLALVGVSLLAAWWPALFLVNLVSGGIWLVWQWCFGFPTSEAGRRVRQFVVFANRQIGHLEALFAWVTFSVVEWPHLWVQIPLITAIATFGPVAIDGITLAVTRTNPAARSDAELHWLRRPLFYIATVLGLVALGWQAWDQLSELQGLFVAVGTGIALRLATWAVWRRREAQRTLVDQEASQQLRERAVEWARRLDWAILVAGMVTALAIPLAALREAGKAAQEAARARAACWCDCGVPRKAPTRVDVALFLVADSQFHALDGKRTGTHLDMVDDVVPVAVRPVELDLLSGATLRHFARLYRNAAERFEADRASSDASQRSMLWAHLGDFGDLGCTSELERAEPFFAWFGSGRLAAVIPGNHDGFFTGNFSWHPDWSGKVSCPSPAAPLRKLGDDGADGALARMSRSHLAPGADVSAGEPFLATVTPLGRTGNQEVLGVFLDTSDYGSWFRLGAAGVQGAISRRQEKWITDRLESRPDALVVVFEHHPYAAMSATFRRSMVHRLSETLGSRLLAIVSAHTHLAARQDHCFNGRYVPELVIGSTTDPPQEAAILEIGPGADGKPALRLRTVPAVSRQGLTCDGLVSDVTDATCRGVLANLRDAEAKPGRACAELFDHDLESLERGSGCPNQIDRWWPSLLPGPRRPPTPDQVKCMQQDRAWRLLKCLRRGGTGAPPRHPLDDPTVYRLIDQLPEGQRSELVCLSWAASVLQGHKKDRWLLGTALDVAYERGGAYGAKEIDVDAADGVSRCGERAERTEACGERGDATPTSALGRP